jgi:hypothetical protein
LKSREEIVAFEELLAKKVGLRDEFVSNYFQPFDNISMTFMTLISQVEEIARSGGQNAKALTRNIMHKIFENEIAPHRSPYYLNADQR